MQFIPHLQKNIEKGATRPIPEWLEWNSETVSAKVLRNVNRDEIDLNVEDHLIVELYSK